MTAWLSAWDSTAPLQTATRIKDAAPLPPDNQLLRLDVIASATDISGGQLRAQGRPVLIPANLRSQFPSKPAPILLEATLQNGVLTASSVQVRNRPQDLGGEILLKGAVYWDGSSTPLTLREASVAIDGSTTIGTNCHTAPTGVPGDPFASAATRQHNEGPQPINCLIRHRRLTVSSQCGVGKASAVDLQSLT